MTATNASPDWNPTQYHRFAAERRQPFLDLLDLVRAAPMTLGVDLGCGSGELTVLAAERLGVVDMEGVDSSPAMLAVAAVQARPGVRFTPGDLATWTSAGDHDLVLANASLHWVPHHETVLARWRAALAPGGQLAVQVPANHDGPAHVVAWEVAQRPHFAAAFGPAGPPSDPVAANVLAPERYATVLHELGFGEQHVRVQVYPHVLDSSRAVVQWVKGTTLTRFEKALPVALFERFVAEYEERLVEVVGDVAPYFFPFKRVLIWGRLPGSSPG